MKNQQKTSKQIGETIRSLRVKNNLTQRALGHQIGYCERQIRRIETEGTKDINTINIFANTFGVSVIDILMDV